MKTIDTLGHAGMSRWLLWGCAGAIGVFLCWAHWARLDQITRASAQVITSSRNQVIQASDGGVLARLLVREGDKVQRGQLLAEFDRTKLQAAYQESLTKRAALKAAVARLRTEVFGGELRFPAELQGYPEFRANQTTLFLKRQSALNEDLQALRQAQALVEQELEMNLPLLQRGDVSRTDVLRLQRQVVDIRSQITSRQGKYLQDSQADLVKAEEDLEGIEQVVAQRKDQLDATQISAPMDGIVRNVRLTTLGGVARAGDEVMQIVPVADELIFEAKVKPAEIAFLQTGLPATIKLDAYDYSIYGVLHGSISHISADTIAEPVQGTEQAYYRVHIRARRAEPGQPVNPRIQIQPGMTATVEVTTGQRSVLQYLTKPITKTLDEALGER